MVPAHTVPAHTVRARTVVVHIDELVVHGLDRRAAERGAAALRSELARLLASGLPPDAGALAELGALTLPEIVPPRGAEPAEVGREVARSLYRALSRPEPSLQPAGVPAAPATAGSGAGAPR
jgi:hypothetical protein